MDFFTELYSQGASYSALNTAKAALLTFVQVDGSNSWKDDPVLLKFFTGCFKTRIPKPKYVDTWNVETVLSYLDNFMPIEEVTFKELTLKTVALVALASGSRSQTVHLMDLNNMSSTDNNIKFFFTKPLKSTKPGQKPHTLEFEKFTVTSRCVVHTLKEYIQRTQTLRQSSHLWISFVKPYKAVSKDTISRWLKNVLTQSGINVELFTAHSFRMASTSKAASAGVGMHSILQTANWSSATNFEKFYHREVTDTPNKIKFAQAVLNNTKD